MRISQKLSHSLIPFMISWARFWLWLSGYNMQNIQLTFFSHKKMSSFMHLEHCGLPFRAACHYTHYKLRFRFFLLRHVGVTLHGDSGNIETERE